MFTLYHHPASPFSRKARIVLGENGLDFIPVTIEPWKRDDSFMTKNPSGEIPVLQEPGGRYICGHRPVCEYISEITSRPLVGVNPLERAEVRRLCDWFDEKFFNEATVYLAGEKIYKRLNNGGAPDSDLIRAGKANVVSHLRYAEWLLKQRNWIAGENFSLADIAAAAQLSVLDYIDEVPWDKTDKDGSPLFEETKIWYARIKSRPSFRPLLNDRLGTLLPSEKYTDLDF